MDILICESHRLFAEALEEALTHHGHRVVGNVGEIGRALTLVEHLEVDLCVLDLSGASDVTDDHIAALIGSGTRLLILAEAQQQDVVVPEVPVGVVAVAEPSASLDHVLEAAERLHEGVHRLGQKAPAGRRSEWTRADMGRFLTNREREVLECLARGESTAELARSLGVHQATARTHIQNVLAKLCVHSRLEAVALAIEHELIRVPA